MNSRIALLLATTMITNCGKSDVRSSPARDDFSKTTLPGSVQVGAGGSYEVSIDVPDAGLTFQPNVSLYYSSQRLNGTMGVGWTLKVGSTVSRCIFIPATDGFAREVRYAVDDRLCIDGERLVLVKGQYGMDSSEYRTELDAGWTITLRGNINDPGSSFTSKSAGNIVNIYAESVIPKGVSTPLTWLLTATRNSTGLSIDYFYNRGPYGETTIKEIRYTGQLSATQNTITPGDRFIRFKYGPRDDIQVSFLKGGESRYTLVVTGVTTGSVQSNLSDNIYREYTMSYHHSLSTNRLLLDRISACQGIDPGRQCAQPTTVMWQDEAAAFKAPRAINLSVPGPILAEAWQVGKQLPSLSSFTIVGDYDADGRREILAKAADDHASLGFIDIDSKPVRQVRITDMMTFHNSRWKGVSGPGFRHLGSADLFGGVGGMIATSDWRKDAFAVPETTSIPDTGDVVTIDADGDGQPDLVTGIHQLGQYRIILYRNTGSTDKNLSFAPAKSVAQFPDNAGFHLDASRGMEESGRTLVVWSDEKIDRLVKFETSKDGKISASVVAASDFGIKPEVQTAGFVLIDINADGLEDLISTSLKRTWTIQMNSGNGFDPPIDTGVMDPRSAVGVAGTLVFDVDSDGTDELAFPARRVTDYCLELGKEPLCSDALAKVEPRMDLGIYEYDAVNFRLNAQGNYQPQIRSDLRLVGQANRANVGDLQGDARLDLVSAFDRGVSNGWFQSTDGSLVECPPQFGCGFHVSSPAHIIRDDREDAALDRVKSIQTSPTTSMQWSFYPLSNPRRKLYSVPSLDSPERFIDTTQYFFTSSMYVVGEQINRDGEKETTTRFEYGGGIYNTQGRGLQGFRWIAVDDDALAIKFGGWYRQEFPFVGKPERTWTEKESDQENDYFHGSPGRNYLTLNKIEWYCYGPPESLVSRKFNCLPNDFPVFRVIRGPRPSKATSSRKGP